MNRESVECAHSPLLLIESGLAKAPATRHAAAPDDMMNTPALAEFFPVENYRHTLKLQTCDPAEFFQPSAEAGARRTERTKFLQEQPSRCAALLPEGEPLVTATVELASGWRVPPTNLDMSASPFQQLLSLGRAWEQDFLLLLPDAGGAPTLVGGVVCFPSSWALEEKVGHNVAWIHEVVPGLNSALRGPVDNFLAKLRPGTGYRRHNWGLSRWPQLNQHPALNLPKLAPPLCVEDVWLRLEHQVLLGLPGVGGVLFGIDVRVHSLKDVLAEPEAARRMRRALETMPEPMANYKNLHAARGELLRLLAV